MAYPKTIAIVSLALFALGLLPGIPLVPVVSLAVVAAVAFWFAYRRLSKAGATPPKPETKTDEAGEDLYRAMQVDPVEIVIGSSLMVLVGEGGDLLAEKLAGIRKQYALDMGVVLPPVRVRDDKRMAAESVRDPHLRRADRGRRGARGPLARNQSRRHPTGARRRRRTGSCLWVAGRVDRGAGVARARKRAVTQSSIQARCFSRTSRKCCGRTHTT